MDRSLGRGLVWGVLALALLAGRGEAGEPAPGPEQGLRLAAVALRETVAGCRAGLAAGSGPADCRDRLTIRYERLRAGHLLMEERYRLRGERLLAVGGPGSIRHREMAERYAGAMAAVETAYAAAATGPVIDDPSLAALDAALAALVPPRPQPLHGLLPCRSSDLAPRPPLTSPSLRPAYDALTVLPSLPADLAASPEAPRSAVIARQAQAIAAAAGRERWDPAVLVDWVLDNIRTEWYWGSMKGAEETLRQRSGNAADQAALLVALLRAAGYPARFVHGTVAFFPGLDAARLATGIDDPGELLAFFQGSGIPCEAVREGGAIVNLRFEHVWVEALIPYANYRGDGADDSGRIWVPIDTTLKPAGYDDPATIDLFARPGHPLTDFRERVLAAGGAELPLAQLRAETDAFLAATLPEGRYGAALHQRRPRPGRLGIVAGTLPFTEVAVLGEHAALPAALEHRVRLQIAASAPAAPPLLDVVVPVRAASNRALVIDYEPASVADQELVNLWGGLDNTPSYLVRLRPVIKLDGERLAVAGDAVAAGERCRLTTTLLAPAGSASVTAELVAGYPQLLGLAAQRGLPPGATAGPAVALLQRAALGYLDGWNRAEEELADLLGVSLARPLPTLVTVGGTLRVDELLGIPQATAWQGLFLDAGLRMTAAAPRTGAAPERVRLFRRLSALEGSAREHAVFEEQLGVSSISTAKLFGLAAAAGVPLLQVDAGNAPALLPTLPLAANVLDDIAAAVAGGLTVTVPARELAVQDWTGIGYLKEDPQSGEAGYMLSGGLAGGQTVLGRPYWPAATVAVLSRPAGVAPNADPAQAATLAAITPREVRLATAGEPLAAPLMVLVRDAAGVPVAGAPVRFTVRHGGGWLVDEANAPGQPLAALTAATDDAGIARAGFLPGSSTTLNPVVFLRSGERSLNLVGENLIDVRLESGSQARLAAPLSILGFAGPPDAARSAAHGNSMSGEVFSYSGGLLVFLRDRFGNPVANRPVAFAVAPVEPETGSLCAEPPGLSAARRNAQLLPGESCRSRSPGYGECADAAAATTVYSTSDGSAAVGVVLGGVPQARYPFRATFATRGGESVVNFAHFSTLVDSCSRLAAPADRLQLLYQPYRDESGRNVDARPAGQPAEIVVKSYLLAEGETLVRDGATLACAPAPDRVCDLMAGTGAFRQLPVESVSIDGAPALRTTIVEDGQPLPALYRSAATLPVGLNDVAVEARGVVERKVSVNSCGACGTPQLQTVEVGPASRTLPIWGVAVAAPEAVTAVVDADGLLQRPLEFACTIEPAAFTASLAQVLIFRDGSLWDVLPAAGTGTTTVTLPSGYWLDPRASYAMQLLLNNPSAVNEVRGPLVPLLQRLTAVDLQVDGLPGAGEETVGAFVLLNNDFDERDADPAVTLPDVATDRLLPGDDELKRAWLQIDDDGGRPGHWQVRASDPARLRIWHRKNGDWVEFRPDDPPEPVTHVPVTIPLYLEGLDESPTLHGDTLTATYTPAGAPAVSDSVPVTMLSFDLAVDGNRDRTIDFRQKHDEAMLFWVNDDHDVAGEEDGQPVEDDKEGAPDSHDGVISCKRDLEDFARLQAWLGPRAPVAGLTFKARMAPVEGEPMVNLFPAVNSSDGYLGLKSDNSTVEQPEDQILLPILAAVSGYAAALPPGNFSAGSVSHLLFEGRRAGRGKLLLGAYYQGVLVAERAVDLDLRDIRSFYDHFVVTESGDPLAPVHPAVTPEGAGGEATRLGSYRPASDEYVLFVHGWNVQPWEKRRWTETIFKRLWWQGYQGSVGLFDWPCRTMPSWDFLSNFDRSEFLAWNSAPALKGVLEKLAVDHPGNVRLLAHSQGNVVAGEALNRADAGLVHSYIASQAALSAGLYSAKSQAGTSFMPGLTDFTASTPDVMGAYPASIDGTPYLSAVPQKVRTLHNYFNTDDYALTGNSLDQPTWQYNNKTRPDTFAGYGYDGDSSTYPPVPPALGFYRNIIVHETEPAVSDRRILSLTEHRYEIFSYCAQSHTRALGAVQSPPEHFTGACDLSTFGYNRLRYSHSRQFRSSVVDEQSYWGRFFTDNNLMRNWQ